MRRFGPLVLSFAFGCHTPSAVDPPAAAPAAARAEPSPEIVAPAPAPVVAAQEPAPVVAAQEPAPVVAAQEPTPGPAVAPPAEPLEPIATWPFHRWDRAEAIRFNHVRYGPGIPLRAYDAQHGWSPRIVERAPVSQEQAAEAVKWTISTGGEVEVSSCPFPRHAIVLLRGATPVGSVNVCFDCGDILVWPDLDRPPDPDTATPAELRRHEQRYKKKLAAYKKIFPRWEKLFRDDLGWTLTPVPR